MCKFHPQSPEIILMCICDTLSLPHMESFVIFISSFPKDKEYNSGTFITVVPRFEMYSFSVQES